MLSRPLLLSLTTAGLWASSSGCTPGAVDDASAPRAAPIGIVTPWGPFTRVDRVAVAPDGVPDFIRGRLGEVAPARLAAARTAEEAAEVLQAALPQLVAAFGVSPDGLVATSVRRDRLGMTHVRYAQSASGLRVVGGELVVHVAADGLIRAVTGTARDVAAVSVIPVVGQAEAATIARLATAHGDVDVHSTELTYVLTTRDGRPHLAWEVGVIGRDGLLVIDDVYVDAHDGRVVDRRPHVFTARNREIFDAQGRSPPFFGSPGPRLGTEVSPPTETVGLAAFSNTGITYDCYQDLFGRDSYDDVGAKLTSVVHVRFRTPNGMSTGNNAAWIGGFGGGGGQMVYGDGDGTLMGPTSEGFDVTAHELTHAVTSSTAQLAYQNESGALNEAMSDIMAAVCEAWRDQAVSPNTWLIGEQIFTPATSGDALRYMANPTADRALYPPALGGSRDFYADRYAGTEDNGGVHLNSGIANLAFYLLTQGGTHPRQRTTFAVPGIGITKAGAIFQRALTEGYLLQNSTFAQARTATEEAAMDLYTAAEVAAVGTAWAAVGIGERPAVDTTPPQVAITAPADGAIVAPGVAVDVTAGDDQGVLRVELAVDGVTVAMDTTAPYAFTTAADLAAGPHTITATAFDTANQATATIDVTVDSGDGSSCTPTCPTGAVCTDGVCVPPGASADGDEAGGCGCTTAADPRGTLVLVALIAGAWRRQRRIGGATARTRPRRSR